MSRFKISTTNLLGLVLKEREFHSTLTGCELSSLVLLNT
jgi:hypothetical protein